MVGEKHYKYLLNNTIPYKKYLPECGYHLLNKQKYRDIAKRQEAERQGLFLNSYMHPPKKSYNKSLKDSAHHEEGVNGEVEEINKKKGPIDFMSPNCGHCKIVVGGNIGVGKSTICKLLEKHIPNSIIQPEPYESNHFLPLYYKEMQKRRWIGYNKYSYRTQLHFVRIRSEREANSNMERPYIIDRSIPGNSQVQQQQGQKV